MNHKKQSFLLAVPLLALGVAVGLSWLWKRRHTGKTAWIGTTMDGMTME